MKVYRNLTNYFGFSCSKFLSSAGVENIDISLISYIAEYQN